MATNMLTEGAEVFSVDGKKIGKVHRFLSGAPESLPSNTEKQASLDQDVGTSQSRAEAVEDAHAQREAEATFAMDRATAVDGGSALTGVPLGLEGDSLEINLPASGGSVPLSPSTTKYLEVHHGGFLHLGEESLYVPFAAVKLIEGDGSILLRYTLPEAAALFKEPPKPLE